MVDTLNEKQTRGALWLMGDVRSGVIALEYKDSGVSLEIMKSSGAVKANYENGGIKIKGDVA